MSENKMPYLSVKDLKVEYYSNGETVKAVNGISFTLEKGKTLGLVGETGAGKTTVAKSILRILPDFGCKVTGGEVYLDGKNLMDLPEEEMRDIRGNDIAMIFQDPMTALNPVETVGDQIEEVVKLHNDFTDEQSKARAEEMLEIVGIPKERYDEYPHQFSGGMKQRVVIAMALACDPDLLLADEPTTALDVTIQAQVLDLIGELRQKFNSSMILITHDMGVVATTCDDVAIVYAGRIIEIGNKEQIFHHPSHPYTIGLFGAIPSMSGDDEWLHPIDGLPPDPTHLPKGCSFAPRCPYATEQCNEEKEVPKQKTADGHTVFCYNLDKVGKEEA